MPITAQQAFEAYKAAELLHSEQAVEHALDQMAAQITTQLAAANPVLLCVLTGGIIPAGKLATRLDFPLQLDYLHATRYRGATRGGELHWIAHPSIDLRDRVVLVIDDILDEGTTLAAIVEHCRAEGASEVLSAVLVDKIHDRKDPAIKADFTGLEVPDRYVFGYGMDYKGYLRNARGIYAAHED
ncbi:MAG: hypoxanthine-guanine phosphoribosyltransferase [Gammaproteobacteria bacterium]